MNEIKIIKKEEEAELKTFPVPFDSGEIKENITITSNTTSNAQIINQAIEFHVQGNIPEAKKHLSIFN